MLYKLLFIHSFIHSFIDLFVFVYYHYYEYDYDDDDDDYYYCYFAVHLLDFIGWVKLKLRTAEMIVGLDERKGKKVLILISAQL